LTSCLTALALAGGASAVSADEPGYTLTGDCAELPADRTTEFHGNPMTSNLNLAMAGNQWVVFDHFMQAFNEYRDARGEEGIDLDALGQLLHRADPARPGTRPDQVRLHAAGERG